MNAYALRVVTPPAVEPISLELARSHLRLDAYGSPAVHDDDGWLTEIGIPSAREVCELFAGRSFAPQTLEVVLDTFPVHIIFSSRWGYATTPRIELPRGPLIGNVSVTYSEGGATPTTLDASEYFADGGIDPIAIWPAASWPTLTPSPGAVRIRYDAGFSAAGESPLDRPLPVRYKHAMLLVLADKYENRRNSGPDQEYELPLGVQALLGFDQARNGFA